MYQSSYNFKEINFNRYVLLSNLHANQFSANKVDPSKQCTQIHFAKNGKLHKFAT